MKTLFVVAVVVSILSLAGTLSAAADDLPAYPDATVIAQDTSKGTTTYTYSLPKGTKPDDVLGFYKSRLALAEWAPSVSVDAPWLHVRSYAKDGRAFGIALYGERMLLLDSGDASETSVADWVREVVNAAAPPVAAVGSDGISYEDYYGRVQRLPYQDPGTGESREAGAVMVERLIGEHVILKLAESEGVSPTDEQIAERSRRMIEQSGIVSDEDLLMRWGVSRSQLTPLMRIEQAAFNLQTKGVTITPTEIINFYNEHRESDFTIPEEIQVAGIFVDTKKDADKCMALLEKGVEFGTVARTMSKHPSAKMDGKLAPLHRGFQGIPESVQSILFATPVGRYTKLIASGGGAYAIFKVLGRTPPKIRRLGEVRDAIRDRLMLEKGMRVNPNLTGRLAEFRKSLDVRVSIERYRSFLTRPK